MKTILLPTDFSDASEKALAFTIEMAKLLPAKIVVTNTFYVPNLSPDMPIPMSQRFYDEAESYAEAKMEKICALINKQKNSSGKNLSSDFVYSYDTAVHAITSLTKEKQIDLVVMGTMANEHILGFLESTTLDVMNQITCPILIVQKDSVVRPFKNVYFALKDLNRDILITNKLVALLRHSEPFITLLHIADRHDSLLKKELEEETALVFVKAVKDATNYSRIRLKKIYEQIPSDELTHFISDHEPDLLVLLKQDRYWLQEIFHRSFTKFLLKHTDTPILIMH